MKNRPFQCPICRKSFIQQAHMREHQRTHTGEKPYTCTECNRSFAFSSALRRHQRLHADARPYQCTICQKTFKQQSVLKCHQLTHSGSFSRTLELTYHMDSRHSNARPKSIAIFYFFLHFRPLFVTGQLRPERGERGGMTCSKGQERNRTCGRCVRD
uniref:C2H2-type domain-containing protein n=1 Tax=Sander lucioperca TaxID=283035 RepID=A0A8C9XF45_SANLU